jgi:hypothetical protein
MTQTSKVLDRTLSSAAFRLFTGTHRFLDQSHSAHLTPVPSGMLGQ